MEYYLILSLGLIAQGLFSARFLIQLTKSELAGKVVSPVIFWQLSLIASAMLLCYGFLRNDIVIIGGQLISYYIYIRNLQLKNEWKGVHPYLRWLFLLLPPIFVFWVVIFYFSSLTGLFNNPDIPTYLLTFGTIGQIVFTFRFIVQWFHSEKKGNSEFPVQFWFISLAGALMITGYAIMRSDPVLFLGQAFGIIVYSRNLYLNYFPKPAVKREPASIIERMKRRRLILFTGVFAFSLFFFLGKWSVTESSEARYAQISKEMVENNSYLHPELLGIKHYHKPPLTYWITIAGYKLFGTNSMGARFFLQIAILIQIITVYGIAKLLLNNKNFALLAAIVYFAIPGVIVSGRALTTDAYLATMVLGAVFGWLKYCKSNKTQYLILFYTALGLGFLTKGPVVLIFPVFIIAGFYFSKIKPFPGWRQHIPGILIFLVIGLGWFLYLFNYDKRFIDYFLINHTIERFATDVFKRSEPWWFYPAIITASSFPWGVLLFVKIFKYRKLNKQVFNVVLFWILGPVLFFSLSGSKLLLYVLPVYAAIAIGSVWVWLKSDLYTIKLWSKIQLIYHLIVLIGLGISPLIFKFIIIEELIYFLIVITASLLITLHFLPLRVKEVTVFASALFMFGITLISPVFMYANPVIVNDTRPIAEYINNIEGVNEIVVFDRRLPSISFNTDKPIISLYNGHYTLNREVQFETESSWKNHLIDLTTNPGAFEHIIKDDNVLIVKSKSGIPLMFKEFVKKYSTETQILGWTIYHN